MMRISKTLRTFFFTFGYKSKLYRNKVLNTYSGIFLENNFILYNFVKEKPSQERNGQTWFTSAVQLQNGEQSKLNCSQFLASR